VRNRNGRGKKKKRKKRKRKEKKEGNKAFNGTWLGSALQSHPTPSSVAIQNEVRFPNKTTDTGPKLTCKIQSQLLRLWIGRCLARHQRHVTDQQPQDQHFILHKPKKSKNKSKKQKKKTVCFIPSLAFAAVADFLPPS
jgi:hypothetical protein